MVQVSPAAQSAMLRQSQKWASSQHFNMTINGVYHPATPAPETSPLGYMKTAGAQEASALTPQLKSSLAKLDAIGQQQAIKDGNNMSIEESSTLASQTFTDEQKQNAKNYDYTVVDGQLETKISAIDDSSTDTTTSSTNYAPIIIGGVIVLFFFFRRR